MASVTNQSSPAVSGVAVTPADGVALTKGTCRSLYIGGAGNISVILANDTVATTFTGCFAGMVLPVMCSTVQATLTTATLIIALY
jgi:hypothetical protein